MKKHDKQRVEHYKQAFAPLMKSKVCVSFGPHSFTTEIQTVEPAKMTQMKNVPEMREIEGKMSTPAAVAVVCQDGTLLFVMDDMDLIITISGVVVRERSTGNPTVTFTQVSV